MMIWQNLKYFFWAILCEPALVWDVDYAFNRDKTFFGRLLGFRKWGIEPVVKEETKARKSKADATPQNQIFEKDDKKITIEFNDGEKRTTVSDKSGGGVIDWETMIDGLERSPELLIEDKFQLELSNDFDNISERTFQKAEIIKKEWAKKRGKTYQTNQEISDVLEKKHGKGYKIRTIKSFTSCFSKAIYEIAVQSGAIKS